MGIEWLLYWILVVLVMVWLELAGGGKLARRYIAQKRWKVLGILGIVCLLVVLVVLKWS